MLVLGMATYSQAQNPSGTGNAQVNNQWRMSGNMADSTNYIGTQNQRDLIFKAGGQEGMRLNPSQASGILTLELGRYSPGLYRGLVQSAEGGVYAILIQKI